MVLFLLDWGTSVHRRLVPIDSTAILICTGLESLLGSLLVLRLWCLKSPLATLVVANCRNNFDLRRRVSLPLQCGTELGGGKAPLYFTWICACSATHTHNCFIVLFAEISNDYTVAFLPKITRSGVKYSPITSATVHYLTLNQIE